MSIFSAPIAHSSPSLNIWTWEPISIYSSFSMLKSTLIWEFYLYMLQVACGLDTFLHAAPSLFYTERLPCLLQLVPVASAFQFDFMGSPARRWEEGRSGKSPAKPASGWVHHSLQVSRFSAGFSPLALGVTPLPFRPGGDNSNPTLTTPGYTSPVGLYLPL